MPIRDPTAEEVLAWNRMFNEFGRTPCKGRIKTYTNKIGLITKIKCVDKPRVAKSHKRHKRFYVNGRMNRYREKERSFKDQDLKAGAKIGVFKTYAGSQVSSTQNVNLTGTPEDSKELWRCWDQTNPGPPYNTGGPFASINYTIPSAQVQGSGTYRSSQFSPGSWWEYNGAFVDDGDWGSDTVSNYLSVGVPALTGYDSRAWDELKPRVSKASLAQFIYELRDLPRQLETTANLMHNAWRSFGGGYSSVVMHPRSVADNFLNHEFGWAPFIGDIATFIDVYQKSSDYIRDLVRQNDTWIKKSKVLLRETTQTRLLRRLTSGTMPSTGDFRIAGCCNDMVVDGITTKGYFDITEVKETKVWAKGTFKYYRPEFDPNAAGFDSQWTNASRLATLYGLRINPTLLYKITPWSWLVDWFSQFGKFIQRQDDFISDGIVSKCLYVMRSTERKVVKTSFINFASGPRAFTWQRKHAMRQRKVADSPYGFDLTFSNLSVRQWAILGAIGIGQTPTGFVSRGT